MNGRTVLALSLVAVAGVLVVAWRRADAYVGPDVPDDRSADTLDDEILSTFILPAESVAMTWKTELETGRGEAYAGIFRAAEQANGLPSYLLARVAWQESHYRSDIITGQVKSKAGALGIMQIVPRWHPGVDPLDPVAAINYAGGYLAKLKRQFGTWQLALMAYNWGPGNVSAWVNGGRAGLVPVETSDYWSAILADVSAATGTAIV